MPNLSYENFVLLTCAIEKITPPIFEKILKESLGADKSYARSKWEQFNNMKGYRSYYIAARTGADGQALFAWAMKEAGLTTEDSSAAAEPRLDGPG